MANASIAQEVVDALARAISRSPLAERALVAGIRRPLLRKHLHLGAIAVGYPRALRRRELRVAQMSGYRLWVNVGEPMGVGPYFFQEPCVAWLTRALIRAGDVCADVGANAGCYTFLLASVVGPNGRVYAFEPNPEFASLIRQSRELNPFGENIRVDQRALYAVSGERKRFFLSTNPANSGTSSLVDHGVYLSADRTVEVETVTFDDFASATELGRFRLVKIDVELAEEFVLAGAETTLKEGRIDYLIVEMFSGGRAKELLERAGYSGYLLAPERRVLVPIASVAPDRFGDFLFVRPGLEPPVQS